MTFRRVAILLTAVCAVSPLTLVAQDATGVGAAAARSADPLQVVDSVRVGRSAVGAAATIRPPARAIPSTLRVYADRLLRLPISFHHRDSLLVLATPDTIEYAFVAYRAVPNDAERRYLATPIVRPADPDSTPAFAPVEPLRDSGSRASDPFEGSRLRRSGSITRGVIAGSSRDATIESGLRMQLEGEVVDGVQLRAVLSDENTPIVPEGTTQRINEFDKVFIEVSSRRLLTQLGDFELSLGEASFARLSRKLQGARVSANWGAADPGRVSGRGSATVAGAVTRGLYRTQMLDILEGVQGPYRLEGDRGERFIILIPGTEVVFLDGVRLTRGATEDYTVDYATAEITFTPRRVMSPDRRVSVEFQYTTNQFTRTLLAAEGSAGFLAGSGGRPRASVGFTVLRESDGDQFVDEFGLTAVDSLLLAEAGDGHAARSGATEVEYDPEAPYVHYVVERIGDPEDQDSIFVALTSAPADSQRVYRVQFSRVQGGSYVRSGRAINGILYEHVGNGAGEYEPLRLLPQPSRRRMFDVRGVFAPNRFVTLRGEWAQSVFDQNRLSQLDSDDDIGGALSLGAEVSSPAFFIPLLHGSTLRAGAEHIRRGENFQSFDRVRPVEFEREWNLPFEVAATGGPAGERLTTGELAVVGERAQVALEAGTLVLDERVEAGRLAARILTSDSTRISARYSGERIATSSATLDLESDGWRHIGNLAYGFFDHRLRPSFEVETERLDERIGDADSLSARAIRFTEIRPAVAWRGDSFEASLGGEWRAEDRPLGSQLVAAATSWTLQANVRYRGSNDFRVEANGGIRSTRTSETPFARFGIEDRNSVVVGLNGDYRPLNRGLTLAWLYEAQTERTPRLQEIYVRIGPEQGEFVWNDENADGAIQIEEFVRETTPNEGEYARTFVPSDSLFGIVGVRARMRVDLRPARFLEGRESGLAGLFSLLTSATTIEVNENNRSGDLSRIYALDQGLFRTPGLTLNGRLALRQDLSVGRPAGRIGGDLTLTRVSSLADLAAGLETRLLETTEAGIRVRASGAVRLRVDGRTERNKVDSRNFASRTFDLRTRGLRGGLEATLSQSVSLTAAVELARKVDRSVSRTATLLKLPVGVRFQRARRYQISASAEIANVTLDGPATGLAAFELTDGRGAGRSSLWSVIAQYAFNDFLRGSIAYDGRAPAGAPVIHTMRMQLSAVF